MDEKLNVLGVNLNYCNINQLTDILTEYLNDYCMNTISLIHIPTLIMALDDDKFKNYIEELDCAIPNDRAIMEAAGITNESILDDISERVPLQTIFKYLSDNQNTVYILGENEENTDKYYHTLSEKYNMINYIGKLAINSEQMDDDFIVNELNSASADVVISVLKTPFQEKFVSENKNKINAKLWLGLGEESLLTDTVGLKNSWLGKLIDKKLLFSKMKKYDNENGEQ